MFPKILHRVGLIACIVLVISCFMPWITFTFQHETFTGFYTRKFPSGTSYGRPGNFITFLGIVIFIFMYLPRVWAKRTNLFLSAFLLAYVFAVYIRFTNSLFENEIEKRHGIFLLLTSAVVILVACIFPNMHIKPAKTDEQSD